MSGTPEHVVVYGGFDDIRIADVRFLQEATRLGPLHVLLWSDELVRSATGHDPKFPQDERLYFLQAIRYVTQALVSTGHGWLDAEPEIERIRPDIYAVNEDGDKPEKRRYCQEHGIEYVVLKRLPKPGLPKRQSTNLRGF